MSAPQQALLMGHIGIWVAMQPSDGTAFPAALAPFFGPNPAPAGAVYSIQPSTPPGLTVNASTGVVTGTVAPGVYPNYRIRLRLPPGGTGPFVDTRPFTVTASASGTVLIEGFAGGTTNLGTLGGTFVPGNTPPYVLASISSGEARVELIWDGSNVPADTGVAVAFTQAGGPFAQNTPWTFECKFTLLTTATNPLFVSRAITGATVRNAGIGPGLPSPVTLFKEGLATTFSILNAEAGTLGTGFALGTIISLIVTTEWDTPTSNTGQRKYYINGTLIATVNLTVSETPSSTPTFEANGEYDTTGGFGFIGNLNVQARFTDLKLTYNFVYTP